MSNDILIDYLTSLGWVGEKIKGLDNQEYIIIRNYQIKVGNLAGKICDIAIQCMNATPYVPPSAIHTNPALIRMGTYNTQASGIGGDWQYWSRVLRRQPLKPQDFVTHIATIFSEVQL